MPEGITSSGSTPATEVAVVVVVVVVAVAVAVAVLVAVDTALLATVVSLSIGSGGVSWLLARRVVS